MIPVVSMETVFLILSGVILAAGVLYWFWSHIQLTQKKVTLLENAVFELRGLVSGGTGGAGVGVAATPYEDLADDDWDADAPAPVPVPAPAPAPVPTEVKTVAMSTPLEESNDMKEDADVSEADDLIPGGRALSEKTQENTTDRFRALFVNDTAAAAAAATYAGVSPQVERPANETLESMPVKELRRLAEQRGIANANDMKKKEILAALKAQIVKEPTQQGESVVVEKTLDLEAMESSDVMPIMEA